MLRRWCAVALESGTRAPKFRPKIPRFFRNLAPSPPRPSHHARQTPARAISRRRRKPSPRGYRGGSDATRREGADATATKCEMTGNRKARWRGRRRDISFHRPAHPAPVALPVFPASPPFSPSGPPLLPGFWPPPLLRPARRKVPSRRRGRFSCDITEIAGIFAPFFLAVFACFSGPALHFPAQQRSSGVA